MDIGFLLGSHEISGGTNVILEHASRLRAKAHRVSIITREEIDSGGIRWHPAACQVEWQSLEHAREHHFDFVIATWWQSVYLLEQLSASNYIYFVQSIESFFFSTADKSLFETWDIEVYRDWCETTYRFPIPVITEATWIRDYLKEHYNQNSYLVRNGIRKDIYTVEGPVLSPKKPDALRVLVEGQLNVFYKNVENTIKTCQRAAVDEIWLLTSSDIADYPGVERCFSRVPVTETAAIYRSCDVLVKLSYVEGMFGPPLEMFHCGGTTVAYDVTGLDEYIEHGKNGLVVTKGDEDAVVTELNRMKSEPELLETLKDGAIQTANDWPDWSESSAEFERILLSISPGFNTKPSFISEYTRDSIARRDMALNHRAIIRFTEREQVAGDHESDSFINFIQVYWESGSDFFGKTEVLGSYKSGEWTSCQVELPASAEPKVLRIDPSVRMGIVQIKAIRVLSMITRKIVYEVNHKKGWNSIEVAGTAVVLTDRSFLVLECYGEDPQIFLNVQEGSNFGKNISVEIELLEESFSRAFRRFNYISTPKTGRMNKFKQFIKNCFKEKNQEAN